jgi:pSer/pThr/pTyr-binding forkhead associated (FHA) protein
VILDGRAHAIDEHPLVIGFGAGAGRRIELGGAGAGISRSHCTLVRRNGRVVVRDHSRYGTFVNGERVDGELPLGAGDRLRVGSPGVVLELVTVG